MTTKPTIWIFSIEPLETRYTGEWHQHIPQLFTQNLSDKFNVVQIDGVQKNTETTPGAFLNFSDTNYWKSSQLCAFLDHYNAGQVGPNDHMLFTDFWNPVILQLKYMNDLLDYNWTLHGLAHAGGYDKADFLGQKIGNKPWIEHVEKSFYHAYDHTYFATEFHISMFFKNRFKKVVVPGADFKGKVVRTGWPMEYMQPMLEKYRTAPKRNLILFPHRIAPEKQPEIFRDLAQQLPQYEFVVCQDRKLTKSEYHNLLGQAKMVFSANLQETLGISPAEGAVAGAIPLVPDRLSYTEMYSSEFKYPSAWTENWDSYVKHRDQVVAAIVDKMENYNTLLPALEAQTKVLMDNFFSCSALLNNFN